MIWWAACLTVLSAVGGFMHLYRSVVTLQVHGAPCSRHLKRLLPGDLTTVCAAHLRLLWQSHVTCTMAIRRRGAEGASPLCSL